MSRDTQLDKSFEKTSYHEVYTFLLYLFMVILAHMVYNCLS